jgi:hypothetical protein
MPFPSYKNYSYISFKKAKTNKVGSKKNKPIKSSHVEKKIILKSLKKIKHL